MTSSSTTDQRKVLILGIDGGTWDLLDRLMSDGTMPRLAGLLEDGAKGVLRSVCPPLTPAAWATVLTGKGPGGHGVLDFRRTPSRFTPPEGRKREFVSSKLLPRPYLYDLVGNAGRRVVSINVPMTYPPHEINGLMITGMFTPRGSPFTYPPELQEKLGDYEVDLRPGEGPQVDAWLLGREEDVAYESDPLVRGCRRILAKRADAALTLMDEESWSLFFIVLTGGDRICHHLWKQLSDEGDPLFRDIHQQIRQFFAELDAVIAKLVDAAGPDTSTVLVSDHGFGSAARKKVYFDLWLQEQNLAYRKTSAIAALRKAPGNRIARLAVKKLLKLILPARKSIALIQKVGESELDQVTDNSRTLVKSRPLYTGVCGFDLNPDLAAPGSETYEETRRRLIEGLADVRDPDSGERIVEQAVRREDIYQGPFTEAAPDVVAQLNPAYVPVVDPWPGRLVTDLPKPAEGDHRFEGIFALLSPQAVAGTIKPRNLEDVAPTILYLLGLAIPDDMTGQVIREAIREDRIKADPPRRQSAEPGSQDAPAEQPVYSEEEEADIEQRLKDIGYL